ncbi:unnamed protein product, partial [Vitis vinifera]
MASSPSFPTNPLQPSTSSFYLQKLFFFSLYTTHFINLQFVLPSPKALLLSILAARENSLEKGPKGHGAVLSRGHATK